MSTRARNHVTSRPIERELKRLQREVDLLRGGLISVLGEDREGAYRPEFVSELLHAAEEPTTEKFTNPAALRWALRAT